MPKALSQAGRTVLKLLLVSVLVFLVTRIVPRTPMEVYLANLGLPVTDENVAAVRREWGLDTPLLEQYFGWVGGLLRGDWGVSLLSGQPIAAELLARVPVSLALGLGGLALAAVISYPLGMLAATRGGFFEGVSRALAVAAQAVPSFVVAIVVINLFGVYWGWVPFYTLSGVAQLVAPVLILALYLCGQLSRIVAENARQLINQPHSLAAQGRGFSLDYVLWRQSVRQIWYGILAAMIAKMSWVIGGASILEYVFAVPGMSYYVITSIQGRDYQVVQSYLMLLVLWMLAMHLVFDFILRRLDPRAGRQ